MCPFPERASLVKWVLGGTAFELPRDFAGQGVELLALLLPPGLHVPQMAANDGPVPGVRIVELQAGPDLQAGHRPPECLLPFDQKGLAFPGQVVADLGGEGLVAEGPLDGDAGLALLESLAEGLVADGGYGAFGARREDGRIAVEVAPVGGRETLPPRKERLPLVSLITREVSPPSRPMPGDVAEDRLLGHVAPTAGG